MDGIDRVRAFNRFWTERMGLLDRNYLGSDLSVSEARVIHELAVDGPARARDLARRLSVDEGYLSRIVARLGGEGWLSRVPDPRDGRARLLTLTRAGRAHHRTLAARSRADVQDRLANLQGGVLEQAVMGMERIQRALGQAPTTSDLRDLQAGDIGWLIQQHAELYARDEGFDATFETLVAEILLEFARSHDRATERGFIAEAGGQRLGSIFCVQSGEPGVAKLRLFLLLPEARGQGLGQRLLDACLGFARQAGYRRMRLWTHESHSAACALYAKNRFELTASKPVHSFGVDLVEQTWERDL